MKINKFKLVTWSLTAWMLLLPLLPMLNTYAFGGGDGSSGAPYTIESCSDLEDINNDLDAHYLLTTDLVCTSINLPLAREMDVDDLAEEFAGFSGVLDGDNYTISFAVNVPEGINDSNYLGLFGYLNGATIKNLNLVAGYQQGDEGTNALIGNEDIGSVAGLSENSQIINVHAVNNIISDNGNAGGIVGNLFSSRILGSSFNGNIITNGSQVGGLAGSASANYGDDLPAIERSYSAGNIEGIGNVGGLIGHSSLLNILNSYSDMDVTDNALFLTNFGGIAGYAAGVTIEKSYSSGTIWGNDNVGGIFGATSLSAVNIIDVFSASSVSAIDTVGAVVAENSTFLTYENSYFDSLRAGVNNCIGTGDPQVGCTEIDTTFEAAEYWKYNAPTDEWNTNTVWDLDSDSDFPILRDYITFDDGDGSSETPYEINNCNDLANVNGYLDAYFILNSDLDCSENGNEIMIGSAENPFYGNFDGQDNTITVDINNAGENNTGLFRYISEATISNLNVAGTVIGDENTGGLAGFADQSTISNSTTNTEVNGVEKVGGLIGYAEDATTIYRSVAYGETTANNIAGGIIGEASNTITINQSASKSDVNSLGDVAGGLVGLGNSITILNSYSQSPEVSGNSYVGGLVGEIYFGQITNSYAYSIVTAASNYGGFIGSFNSSAITNSYFDTDRANTEVACSTEVGEGCDGQEISGLTTESMQDIETYYTETDDSYGFDLNTDNADYRYIKWEISTIRDGATTGCADDIACVQASEFQFYNHDFPIELPTTLSVTNPDGSSPFGEDVNKLIDGTVDTKFLDLNFGNDNSSNGSTVVLFDAGEGETLNFNRYNWFTANDESSRDPITWTLSGSNDGEVFEEIASELTYLTTTDRLTAVNIEKTDWNFVTIWTQNIEDNNGLPFLRFEDGLTLPDENTDLEGDDECTGPIDLGFDFEYFGETFDSVYFSTNGILDFDDCDDEYDNNEAPLDGSGPSSPPDFALLPFWDDLESDFENSYYRTTGAIGERIFIAQWTLQHHHTSEEDELEEEIPVGTIQVLLYEETGEIKFQYLNLKNGDLGLGASATIGLTGDSEDNEYTSFSHLETSLESNLAILFTPNGPSAYEFDDEAELTDVFLIDQFAPSVPELTTPADESGDTSITPSFSWTEATGADYYRFFISTTPDFNNGFRIRADGTIDNLDEGVVSNLVYSQIDIETTGI